MQNIDNNSVKKAAQKANIDVNELKQAAQNGKIDDFIDKNLSKEASQKLKNILSDKSATEKLLSTPQAKELLNKLLNK
jgi:cytidylate kinase